MTPIAILWATVFLMAAWSSWRWERAAETRAADRGVAAGLDRLFSTEGWE